MRKTEHEQIIQMSHLSLPDSGNGILFQMCGITFPNRKYAISRPISSVSCLETVRSGKGTVILDGCEYRLGAGDTYLLPEGHNHRYYADRRDPWEKIWVNFSGPFSLSLLRLWGLESACVFRGLDLSPLLQQLQVCAAEGDPKLAAGRCTGILAEAFTRMASALTAQPDIPLTAAQELRRYIDRHLTEPLRTEQLAAHIGRSVSQAQRLFRAEFGIPLYRYVLDGKLSLACRLLRETGMTVREIAAYLSFEDEFYFSGLFHRKIGLSPSKYREQQDPAAMPESMTVCTPPTKIIQ